MRRALLCVALIAVFPGFWKAGRANAAAENQQQVTASQGAAAVPASPRTTSAPRPAPLAMRTR